GVVLDVHHAEGPSAGAKRRDHRLARGRVAAALNVPREEHRLPGLRDLARDAFADALAVLLRRVGEAFRAAHRELALRVGEHDRHPVGAKDLGELRGGALQELVGIALAVDDRLQIAIRLELGLSILLLALCAPEGIRLRKLETDELGDSAEPREILGPYRSADDEGDERADELVLPYDRGDRDGVSHAPIREAHRDAA